MHYGKINLVVFSETYLCSICRQATSTTSLFFKHASLHKNVNGFHIQCPFQGCSKVFKKIGSIYSHVAREHQQVNAAEGQRHIAANIQSCDRFCTVQTCICVSENYRPLVAHLKGHILQGTEVRCPFLSCQRVYKNKASFSSHLSRYHGNCFYTLPPRETQEPAFNISSGNAQASTAAVEQPEHDVFPETRPNHASCSRVAVEDCNNHVTEAFAQLYLRLLAERHVPSCTVQVIAEAMRDIQSANV